jgi:SAM-dependent methyltransferase
MPTEEELHRFYAEGYRAEHEPGVGPETAHRMELPEARARVERLTPLLGPALSLLEIGSSSGAFVASVSPFVRSAAGVEPARVHRQWAKDNLGATLFEKLDDVGTLRFDRIVLFHVLEHVREPIRFVKTLLALLNPGGKLVVEVPSASDALLTLYQVPDYPAFYYQNAHLWYFTPETLALVARAAGAEADIKGVQRYDLSNHLRWLQTGKPGGMGFYKNVFSPAVDLAYRESLVRAGRADTLWAVIEPASGGRRAR